MYRLLRFVVPRAGYIFRIRLAGLAGLGSLGGLGRERIASTGTCGPGERGLALLLGIIIAVVRANRASAAASAPFLRARALHRHRKRRDCDQRRRGDGHHSQLPFHCRSLPSMQCAESRSNQAMRYCYFSANRVSLSDVKTLARFRCRSVINVTDAREKSPRWNVSESFCRIGEAEPRRETVDRKGFGQLSRLRTVTYLRYSCSHCRCGVRCPDARSDIRQPARSGPLIAAAF